VPAPAPRVTIVDTVGVLAEAYGLADVAYVGGAFSTGVHSVIEPAIASLPVVFGPRHDNSFEALQLLAQGAGFAVNDEGEVLERLRSLLLDERARSKAGERARAYVESQLGATEKCLAAIDEYL
jgi:3-deoxy-D-manno-octulosonic-acid transferase